MQFPPETVREIAQLLAKSDLGELSFEAAKGCKLTLKRKPKFYGAPVAEPPALEMAPETAAVSTPLATATEGDSSALIIASPCVGVFHAAQDAVEVGFPVKAQQVVGSVESLKVPNEIQAPTGGVVAQVWVSDGQGVEWGQPLFEIRPSALADGAAPESAMPDDADSS